MSLPNQYTTASPPLSSSKQCARSAPGSSSAPRPQPIQQQPEHKQGHREQIEGLPGQHYKHEPERPSDHQSIPRHPFQPFFTLIEDANTGEYHHPTVHYIFSDDDTDILTEAAVRSIGSEQENGSNNVPRRQSGNQRDQHEQEASYNEEDELSGLRKDSLLPPPIPGVRDNYIILDVEPTSADTTDPDPTHTSGTGTGTRSISTSPATNPAPLPPHQSQNQNQQQQQQQPQFAVKSSQSLTPSWQVLHTSLVPAPTFESNASPDDQKQHQQQPLNGGLMLKIHGTPGLPPVMVAKDRDKERGSQRLEDMMEQFAKRMNELRLVIEAGELGQQHHHQYEQQEQEQGQGHSAPGDHQLGGFNVRDTGNNTTTEREMYTNQAETGPSDTQKANLE